MKIGELAKKADTSAETIRYYEQAGLLPKTMRSEGNYRIYSSPHLEQLIFVRHCRSLDMTLDEIRILLNFKASPDENCAVVNQLLDEHIGHVAQRIVELQELERQLRELRQRCPDNRQVQHCGILKELSQSVANEKMPTNHVAGVHVGTSHRTSQ
ncbi:MAG: Cd(II)/Pb(II)-responsive transcriptional regulator [Azonexus sp.]|jgi:Cd(II)/Pb(II)-responsive transcriptional regulator|uniref:Cd(II)/Pb(II)-responsive transcriptional regulator n=1 Tax=Azonexus sp. R2A61 TaxID=2744443 RepID=UPI001BBCCCF0|nr:Cd(II)/Pb(II)-responsive transcriptional regulator [Azonexus sp. R2A61]MBS4018181.1 Cd(II)/Pb(II)-responsive transcriptional regulator [Dechloromonas sp.]MBV2193425.1 Cd(II)/Pb(II)-responsive transcriptional regulator [Azonexus sp.]HPT28738.1 Cd(II)/Pb(II)-responsive transcriptional regulator [Bryobacteraceae bacterium]